MSRICTVCTSPHREAIDTALIGGEPVVRVASRYFTIDGKALGRMAMQRHKDEHLPATLAKAEAAKEISRADDLLAQVEQLKRKAIALLLKAEASGDYRTALAGVREARACLELLLEVEGEIDRRPVVNILVSDEWLRVRGAIIAALDGHPEAQRAVVGALSASVGEGR